MGEIKLNETPVRTAKNYNINNIKLENVEIPKEIPEFNNVLLTRTSSPIEEIRFCNNTELTYGISEELNSQALETPNQKITILVQGKNNEESNIEFNFDAQNSILVDNIDISAMQNTKSTIVIKYYSPEDLKAFHNGIIRVHAMENSNIDVFLVNLMNTKSENFISIENEIEAKAKVNYTIVDFGGAHSITNY